MSHEQNANPDRKNDGLERSVLPVTNPADWQIPLKFMARTAHDLMQAELQNPKTTAMLARLLLQDFSLVSKDDPMPGPKTETDLLQRALVGRVPDKVQDAIKLAVEGLGGEDFNRREAAQK